ncbi:DEKNAAC103296 [Brettanomyces naardenensis]|uniref:Phenylalanine--tRNA ligase, mitochondrial n=1 Tax=Brettanomyces naardenensis TaxID=13370 RepID=A0A448YMV3_BRENA|nr:DEKNAAC103296 [Brettanomyces naardenensis]
MLLVHRIIPRIPLRLSQRFISSAPAISVLGQTFKTDSWTNATPQILNLVGRDLYKDPNHPVGILKSLVENRFNGLDYTFYDDFNPVVSTYENFDVLGFPADHPGRSVHDSYYLNSKYLLRTHTSAHEHQCFKRCHTPGYFITGDVYRRDEIDRTHYPVFHQMEGARQWVRSDYKSNEELLEKIQADLDATPKSSGIIVTDVGHDPVENPKQDYMSERETDLIGQHLKRTIEVVVSEVFNAAKIAAKEAGSKEEYLNEPLKIRWVEAYFPWTSPSWEIEVWWKGEWLECCGCGLVREQVFKNSGKGSDTIGWAFGIGLDRIAMLLFDIPDIRLFWTQDARFRDQFREGKISLFSPYSKYPGSIRDISFWLPKESDGEFKELHANDLMEAVRANAGDLAESVKLIDEFVHPKTGRKSQCYRVNYQSMDRNVTNEEVNRVHDKTREELVEKFGLELR